MALRGILFDLDGTLIQFQIDYRQCRLKTIKILERHGYPPNELNEDHFVLKMLHKAISYFKAKKHYSNERINEIRDEVDREVAKVEKLAAEKAKMMPYMNTMLDYGWAHRLKMGIITLNTSANAILSLKKADLIHYFPDHSLILGREQTANNKPHPEPALTLLERMGLAASEVCIIGDHPSDIETANNINARSIAVVSQKHPKEEFHTPYFIDKSRPFPKIISILEDFRLNN